MKPEQHKNMTPVSVIVSAYAEAPYLEDTLASVAGQLNSGDELIVFHDGVEEWSTAAGYRHDVQYTTYRAGRKLGLERSWSHALMLGKNDWILWMHHDDLLRDGALSMLKKAVFEHPMVTLACGGYITFTSGKDAPDWSQYPLSGGLREVDANQNLAKYLFSFQHICSGLLMKRTALEAVLPIPGDFGPASDVWLYQRLAFQGNAVFLRDVTAAYRAHPGTETNRCLSNWRGRRAWSRSRRRQMTDCCNLIRKKQLSSDFVARVAEKEPGAVIMDIMRALIRARSGFARPLAEAMEKVRPELLRTPGWRRIKIALALGPWSLEATGAVVAVLNKGKDIHNDIFRL